MTDTFVTSVNPTYPHTSHDGLILDVNTSDLGNADTSYTYIPFGLAGFNGLSLDYAITATTLTFEATNDDPSYGDNADELITATNDRTFAGAGNWEADGTGASVVVNAGGLDVTVGNADTGAKLDKAYFNSAGGFVAQKRYTVTLDIASLSAGTVTVLAGTQIIATGLTDGASQTITFQAAKHGTKLSIVGTTAAATFTIDDLSIVPVSATWSDITQTITDGAASSITATGSVTVSVPLDRARLRVKRVTTNATNALELRLTRSRIC